MNVSYCFPCWKLPDKVRHDARFPFGYRLSAVFQAFQYPCHVIAQGAHRLQSLGVLRGFARQTTMHAVPVLGAYDGHVVYREILVQPVERGACPSAPTDGYGSRRFVAQQRRRGIKQPVEQGAERTVGARIIDGRTDDDAVRRFQFLTDRGVQRIAEHASARFRTTVAGDAPLYRFGADGDDFRLDAIRFKGFRHFRQGNVSVSFALRTSINQ